MTFGLDQRWLAVGCAILALAVGLLVPRPSGFATRGAHVDATVPPELTRPDSSLPALPGVSPTTSTLTVDVCGAVRKPGVLQFAPGARAVDAVRQAGGVLPDADLDQINLAQPLTDAMKLCVPRKGQTVVGDLAQGNDAPMAYHPRHRRHSSHGRSAHKLLPGQTLDVNSASAEELTQLPGVGPGLAQRIIDFRQQNGPFQAVDDLQNVPGLGASKFDRLAPFVRI